MVHVEMFGDPNKTINRCLEGQLESDDLVGIKSQAVIYSNSKTNTEGSLLTDATKICKQLYSATKVRPDAVKTFADSLTGGDGIKTNAAQCMLSQTTLKTTTLPKKIP